MPNTDDVTVQALVGRNAARIRGQHKLDDVAVRARALGLRWNSGRVSDLERGRISPTIPTLLLLSMALADLTGEPVRVADLVQHEGDVMLTPTTSLPGSQVVGALSGEPARRGDARSSHSRAALVLSIATEQAGGESEQRVAQSLGIAGKQFRELSQELWGRPFAAERDSRAGEGASPQKRGRVARTLKKEMEQHLEVKHGND